MKKIFYLASIAALALSSCAKDETTGAVINTVGGSKILAAVEADDTRTHLEEVDGKYEFRWSKNDILGVYGDGANSAPNVAFTLLDSSIDQAAGVFESNYKLLAGDNYVAYYPYQPGSDMAPTWSYDAKKNATLNPESITLSIPESQNYAPATFNTLTAPAISDTFVLDEDGNADVTMQPVADYLFVNMMSTEPIQKLTLKLYENGKGWLPIAGTGTLYPYVIKDTEKVRYALGVEGMTKTEITLNSGQLTGAVCHEPNVYVFTIPAGILGMNRDIMARVIVNDGEVTTNTQGVYYFDTKIGKYAPQLNGGVIPGDGKTTEDKNEFREVDWSKTPAVATRRIENTVFWMNEMIDTDGDEKVDTRSSFLYNPEDAFIIRNEVDFLQYMNEYENGGKLGDKSEAKGKDAFVCSEYKFDFSADKMGDLATEVKEAYLRSYVSDYIANGMPCVNAYQHDFRGNGAVLKGIEGLQSWLGLFGSIAPTATISDITFENITAAPTPLLELIDTRATGALDQYLVAMSTLMDDGFILGSVATDNEKANNISKVTVKNAKGGSVFGIATVAAFNGVTFDGVAGLSSAAALLRQNNDLDMTKTWDSVKGVKNNVFGMIKAVEVEDAEGKADGHHVVTIAKGGSAEYKHLAAIIYVAGYHDFNFLAYLASAAQDPDFDFEEWYEGMALEYYLLDGNDEHSDYKGIRFKYDNCATSVVIENVSFWTSDFIDNVEADKNGNFAIAYAEQLANGLYDEFDPSSSYDATVESWSILQRDMNLNFANNYTYWPMSAIQTGNLDGNKKTITGFDMFEYDNAFVAPFAEANVIKDLTVQGVNIKVATTDGDGGVPVPYRVSGLVDFVETGLTNVAVNGINFAAQDYTGGFNDPEDPYYAPTVQPVLGWVAGWSTNAQYNKVSANVTSSNIKGVSALVGRISLLDVTESHFEDCSLTTGKIAQQPLTYFVPMLFAKAQDGNPYDVSVLMDKYNVKQMNVAGTMVGLVENMVTGEARSIEFNGSGAPKFIYDAGMKKDDNKINVLYNDKKHTTLLGLEE